MSRHPHSRFHDGAVALIAATALLWGYLIGTWLNQDPAPENPPSDGAATPDPDRVASTVGTSRGAGRSVPPAGLVRVTPPAPGKEPRTPPSVVPVTVGKPSPGAGGLPTPWGDLAACESSGDPQAVSASGTYRGLFQFSIPTWLSVGGTGDPAHASVAEQLRRAKILQSRSGWGQWPQCAAELGLTS